jgi:hypothetical protein
MDLLSDDCMFLIFEKTKDADVCFICLICERSFWFLFGRYRNSRKFFIYEKETDRMLSSLPRFLFGISIGTIEIKNSGLVISSEYVLEIELFSIADKYGRMPASDILVAKKGQLEILKYLHKRGCKWNRGVTYAAAERGHLEVLKYAHENGHLCNWMISAYAARGGRLDILKYVHETGGCPLNEMACINAAREGHLEVLKYLHENGCPWDVRICARAAGRGHLEILKYAHENGCPWDEMTCTYAESRGHLDCLEYARQNSCPE